MPKMRAAQIAKAGGPIELVEREIPQPPAGWVRIKIQACGICHGAFLVNEGYWPGLQCPRVHGHEVVGVRAAVLGLGGLGHLGVQYAVKMGFKTVGIARGKDKEPLAHKLGAHQYIDSQAQDVAAELQKLGGAKAILATVTNGDAMSATQGGLGLNGTLMVIGAAESMQVSPLVLLSGRRSIKGWYSGTAIDSQDTLR